jgi:hypothetical protein
VRTEEVLHSQGEEEYPHKIKSREANSIGHIWHRKYLTKRIFEGKVEERGEENRRKKT